MSEFGSLWPDVRLWAITRLRSALAGVSVSAERDESKAKQVVVSVVPQQLETTVSRFYLVTVEAWDSTDKQAAFNLSGLAAFTLESAPRKSPLVKAALNAGPNENRDPDSGEYSYSTVVLMTFGRIAF